MPQGPPCQRERRQSSVASKTLANASRSWSAFPRANGNGDRRSDHVDANVESALVCDSIIALAGSAKLSNCSTLSYSLPYPAREPASISLCRGRLRGRFARALVFLHHVSPVDNQGVPGDVAAFVAG